MAFTHDHSGDVPRKEERGTSFGKSGTSGTEQASTPPSPLSPSPLSSYLHNQSPLLSCPLFLSLKRLPTFRKVTLPTTNRDSDRSLWKESLKMCWSLPHLRILVEQSSLREAAFFSWTLYFLARNNPAFISIQQTGKRDHLQLSESSGTRERKEGEEARQEEDNALGHPRNF